MVMIEKEELSEWLLGVVGITALVLPREENQGLSIIRQFEFKGIAQDYLTGTVLRGDSGAAVIKKQDMIGVITSSYETGHWSVSSELLNAFVHHFDIKTCRRGIPENAVVRICAFDNEGNKSVGSGVFVNETTIITDWHVGCYLRLVITNK